MIRANKYDASLTPHTPTATLSKSGRTAPLWNEPDFLFVGRERCRRTSKNNLIENTIGGNRGEGGGDGAFRYLLVCR